uniref:hypothetical protein n=1 Tax=Halomonas sp. TaxID=1486246 RepID=UPI0026197D04|nr:hypothetical protein [Halomonas sp.]
MEFDNLKVLIHIGMPKSGSTAIQNMLRQNMQSLLSQGIYFPLSPIKENDNQAVVALCRDKEDLPRDIYNRCKDLSQEEIDNLMLLWLENVGKKCNDESINTVVISSEYLFSCTDSEIRKLKKCLTEHLGDVEFEVVCYARDPINYWTSLVKQLLKADYSLVFDPEINYSSLLSYKRIFRNLKVFDFSDKESYGGDIAYHFFELLGCHRDGMDLQLDNRSNESFSTEAASINREFRKSRFKDRNGVFTEESRRFLRVLSNADKSMEKPQGSGLVDNIKNIVYSRNIKSIEMLKNEFDINYSESSIEVVDSSGDISLESIDDLFYVDHTRRERLLMDVCCRLSNRLEKSERSAGR